MAIDTITLLANAGVIDDARAVAFRDEILKTGAKQEDVLEKGGITAENILKARGDYYGVPTRRMGDTLVPFDILQYIPDESAVHYRFVPLAIVDNVLEIGVTDPENLEARDALTFISAKMGMPYKVFLISDNDFDKLLTQYKGLSGEVGQALGEIETVAAEKSKEDVGKKKRVSLDEEQVVETETEEIAEGAPVTKIVATILRHAVEQRASDIHIEPMADQTRVRFRIDGVLIPNINLPSKVHSSVAARIKVLSNMRLDEKRKPQDGRFSARVGGVKVDFRVSTFPTYYGEKVVMRILGSSAQELKLESLGFSGRDLELIRAAIKKPYGLVLVSGPTGSGKSTTLYAILNEVDRESNNVLSLEDPIEYTIQGVSQSQVRPEIGYDFANGLRTTLRQDPNIIMVGEIRDGETASLAIQAALTGHLVLSTIHTNSAIGIVPRLLDMGVEPYLISPVLILGMAQRLVKTLCPGTGKKVPINASIKKMFDEEFKDLPEEYRNELPSLDEVYQATPTTECPTGLMGRISVGEVYGMNPELERAILDKASEEIMFATVRKHGMLTMREDAIIKAVKGLIPFEEVNTLGGAFEMPDEAVATAKAPSSSVTAAETQPVPVDIAEGDVETAGAEPGGEIIV